MNVYTRLPQKELDALKMPMARGYVTKKEPINTWNIH